MKIILDTSIWIEYLRKNPKYYDVCNNFLEEDCIYTIEIIFGELLQGAKGNSEIEGIHELFDIVTKIEMINIYLKGGNYSREEKLFNRGIGLIDACIISATIESNAKLWTLDKKILSHIDRRFLFEP